MPLHIKNPTEKVYYGTSGYGLISTVYGTTVVNSEIPIGGIGLDKKSGSGVPGYKRKLRMRINANSGYERKYCEVIERGHVVVKDQDPPGNLKNTSSGFPNMGGALLACSYSFADQTDQVSNHAIAKLRADLALQKNADFAFLTNVPQDIYQAKQTAIGAFNALADFIGMISDLERGHYGQALATLPALASQAYLTLVFGIMPTIDDMKGVYNTLSKLKRDTHTRRISASANDVNEAGIVLLNTTGASELTYIVAGSRTTSVKYTAGVKFSLVSNVEYENFAIKPKSLDQLANVFHTKVSDIFPMLWEIMPWSWVLDYVANIGDVITDNFQSNSDTITYITKSINVSDSVLIHLQSVKELFPGIRSDIFSSKPGRITQGTYTRSDGGDTLPVRSLSWRSSEEMNKHWESKIANLVAVVVTLSEGSKKGRGMPRGPRGPYSRGRTGL